jgi:tRNA 2-thiocytidine biosynthesis protein TtcA
MLADWERQFPGRTATIFRALRNVELEHLADPRRFDFAALDFRRLAPMSEREEHRLEDALAAAPMRA